MANRIRPTYLVEAARGGARARVTLLRETIARASNELAFLEQYFHGELNGIRKRGRPVGSRNGTSNGTSKVVPVVTAAASEIDPTFAPTWTGKRPIKRAKRGTVRSRIATVLRRSRVPLLLREVRTVVSAPGVSTALTEMANRGEVKRIPGEGKRNTRYALA